MKHIIVLSISLVSVQSMLSMEPQEVQSTRNLITAFHWQQVHATMTETTPLQTYAPGGIFSRGEFVAIDIDVSDTQKLSHSSWKEELAASIKAGKTTKLLYLLSPEGQPATSRSLNFIAYQNALEQVRAHKDREVRILTNTAEANAKCCKCCNPTFIWNRHVAPGIIVVFKAAQMAFAAWAVHRAYQTILVENPTDYVQAILNAAPAIGALAASVGEAPFSLLNAYRRRILKTQQGKYEYLLLAEHNIETHDNIEKIVRENQQLLRDNQGGINQLLTREQSTQSPLVQENALQEQPHDNNMEAVDLNAEFGDGILLGQIK